MSCFKTLKLGKNLAAPGCLFFLPTAFWRQHCRIDCYLVVCPWAAVGHPAPWPLSLRLGAGKQRKNNSEASNTEKSWSCPHSSRHDEKKNRKVMLAIICRNILDNLGLLGSLDIFTKFQNIECKLTLEGVTPSPWNDDILPVIWTFLTMESHILDSKF